jgi:hypothetical protein
VNAEYDHYSEAERLLADAAKVVRRHDDECPEADRLIAEAHVHAVLAVADRIGQPRYRFLDPLANP